MINSIMDLISSFTTPFKFWIVIAPWEQGLRVRLGKTSKKLYPGTHFRIPFLDRVYCLSTRERIHFASQTVTSKDGKTLSLGVVTSYSIEDLEKVLNFTSMIEGSISKISLTNISNIVSNSNVEDISPNIIEKLLKEEIEKLDFKSKGFKSINISITNFVITKSYRLITGDSWFFTGSDNDEEKQLKSMMR